MSVDHLRELMTMMYPDGDSESEHPMTAVGIVLLAAALLGITEEEALFRFTGYSRSFIAAILSNLRGNRAEQRLIRLQRLVFRRLRHH